MATVTDRRYNSNQSRPGKPGRLFHQDLLGVKRSLRRWGFTAFIRLPMAREKKKRVELRPVDGDAAPPPAVVRLENSETGYQPKDEELVRLGPSNAGREPSRLDMPSRDEVELRTHQPDIGVLIDSALAAMEPVEDGWGGSSTIKNPIPWGWFALIGLVIVGALMWSATHWGKAEEQAEQIREEAKSVLVSEEQKEKEARELVGRIEEALKRFFMTVTVDALARQVRQPERVLPLMRKHYSRHPLRVNSMESVRSLQPLTLDGRANFWVASVSLFDGGKHNLVVEIDPGGNPLIDWETFVCDQPMPWDEFARERPAGKSLDFRVYAERDTFYSHEFSDTSRWLCFRLTALDCEESMFGYVLADSENARTMLKVLEMKGGGRASLILRLGIPERLVSRHGVVIEKVLSNRWIYLDPPKDAP